MKQKGGETLSPECRAEYFKERRAKYKMFSVEVEREKMETLETRLNETGETKKEWLSRKIDEEISEEK